MEESPSLPSSLPSKAFYQTGELQRTEEECGRFLLLFSNLSEAMILLAAITTVHIVRSKPYSWRARIKCR